MSRATSDNMRAHDWSPRRERQMPPATIFVRRGSPTAHRAERIENKFIDTACAPQRVHADRYVQCRLKI